MAHIPFLSHYLERLHLISFENIFFMIRQKENWHLTVRFTDFPLLEELQAMRGQEKPHLLLSLGGETQKLFLSDLLFVESDNHYLTLHTAAGMETFKKNLSEFREELSAAWQASGETGEFLFRPTRDIPSA